MNCQRLEDDNLLGDLGSTLDAHVEQCEDCRERLRGYQQIARWIAAGRTTHRLPQDWKQRTLARVHAIPQANPGHAAGPAESARGSPAGQRSQVPWRIFATSVVTVSAAALFAVFVVQPEATPEHARFALVPLNPGAPGSRQVGPPDDDRSLQAADAAILASAQLAMQIVENEGWRSSPQRAAAPGVQQRFDAHAGQVVHARALPAGAPYFEIRVYRGARDLIVRCPDAGPPVCVRASSSLFVADDVPAERGPPRRDPAVEVPSLLIWKIPSVGTYQVVFLVSQQPIAPPRGSLNDDVTAASAAGARAIDVGTIHVH